MKGGCIRGSNSAEAEKGHTGALERVTLKRKGRVSRLRSKTHFLHIAEEAAGQGGSVVVECELQDYTPRLYLGSPSRKHLLRSAWPSIFSNGPSYKSGVAGVAVAEADVSRKGKFVFRDTKRRPAIETHCTL